MNNEKVTKFYYEFFLNERRRKNEMTPQNKVKEVLFQVINELKEKDSNFLEEKTTKEDNNLMTLLEKSELGIEPKSIDNAYAKYLQYCSGSTNPIYFKIMCKFVVMSRDFLLKNKVDVANDGANNFPDQCNDFVSDYVEKKKEFELEIPDTIDMVQHFCFWLHEKEYTKSVLTLLSYD